MRLLARYGVREVVLSVAYLGEQIERRIGVVRFGVRISYVYDGPKPVGTLGAIREALPYLGERFLVLYGDTYLRLELPGGRCCLAAQRPAGEDDGAAQPQRWDTSNASFCGELVTAYDKRTPTKEMSCIDYGLGGLGAETIDRAAPELDDLADLYHELAVRGELFGYVATERFYEIGTPAGLAEANRFLS